MKGMKRMCSRQYEDMIYMYSGCRARVFFFSFISAPSLSSP